MDKQEGLSTNRAPCFDGSNYTFWRIRMEVYLQSLGMDIWKLVEQVYRFPKTTPVEPEESVENEHTIPRTTQIEPEDRSVMSPFK